MQTHKIQENEQEKKKGPGPTAVKPQDLKETNSPNNLNQKTRTWFCKAHVHTVTCSRNHCKNAILKLMQINYWKLIRHLPQHYFVIVPVKLMM